MRHNPGTMLIGKLLHSDESTQVRFGLLTRTERSFITLPCRVKPLVLDTEESISHTEKVFGLLFV